MCISGIAVVSSIAIPEAVSLSSFQFQVSHNTNSDSVTVVKANVSTNDLRKISSQLPSK